MKCCEVWTKNNRDHGIVDTLPPSTSKHSNHAIARGVIPLNGLVRSGRGGRITVGGGGTRNDVSRQIMII